VDDSSVMRKIVGRPLRQASLELQEVLEASNGPGALTMAREHPLDFILSDIKLPMMDGLDFVRQLRDSEDDQNVPVVMITAEASEAPALAQRGGVGIARMIMHHFSSRLRSESCSEKAGWTCGR